MCLSCAQKFLNQIKQNDTCVVGINISSSSKGAFTLTEAEIKNDLHRIV